MEEFSSTLGGRLLGKFGVVEKKRSNYIGPANYDLKKWPENVLQKTGTNVKRDLGFGTAPRFPKKQKSCTPGPATC